MKEMMEVASPHHFVQIVTNNSQFQKSLQANLTTLTTPIFDFVHCTLQQPDD